MTLELQLIGCSRSSEVMNNQEIKLSILLPIARRSNRLKITKKIREKDHREGSPWKPRRNHREILVMKTLSWNVLKKCEEDRRINSSGILILKFRIKRKATKIEWLDVRESTILLPSIDPMPHLPNKKHLNLPNLSAISLVASGSHCL